MDCGGLATGRKSILPSGTFSSIFLRAGLSEHGESQCGPTGRLCGSGREGPGAQQDQKGLLLLARLRGESGMMDECRQNANEFQLVMMAALQMYNAIET